VPKFDSMTGEALPSAGAQVSGDKVPRKGCCHSLDTCPLSKVSGFSEAYSGFCTLPCVGLYCDHAVGCPSRIPNGVKPVHPNSPASPALPDKAAEELAAIKEKQRLKMLKKKEKAKAKKVSEAAKAAAVPSSAEAISSEAIAKALAESGKKAQSSTEVSRPCPFTFEFVMCVIVFLYVIFAIATIAMAKVRESFENSMLWLQLSAAFKVMYMSKWFERGAYFSVNRHGKRRPRYVRAINQPQLLRHAQCLHDASDWFHGYCMSDDGAYFIYGETYADGSLIHCIYDNYDPNTPMIGGCKIAQCQHTGDVFPCMPTCPPVVESDFYNSSMLEKIDELPHTPESSDDDDDDHITYAARFSRFYRVKRDGVRAFFRPIIHGEDILHQPGHSVPGRFTRARSYGAKWILAPVRTWSTNAMYACHRIARDFKDNFKIWHGVTMGLLLIGLFATVACFRRGTIVKKNVSFLIQGAEGGQGNKVKKAIAKKALRHAHNPYQKQKEAQYKKDKLEEERIRKMDELEEREYQKYMAMDDEQKWQDYLDRRAADHDQHQRDNERMDREYEGPGDKMDAAQGPRGYGNNLHGGSAAKTAHRPTPPGANLGKNNRKSGESRVTYCQVFWRSGKCERGDECPYPHVRPLCKEFEQEGKCGRKYCSYSHEKPTKKSEQLLPHSTPIRKPFLAEVMSKNSFGRVTKCNAFITHNVVIVPRHVCAGQTSLELCLNGNVYPLSSTAYISKFMPDQCWFPKPAGMKTTGVNNQFSMRTPADGEDVILSWLENNAGLMTAGKVSGFSMMGREQEIKAWNYSGSTKAGSCGSPYISLVDGAIIGFHGVGSTNVNVLPQFFGINAMWVDELKTFANKFTYELTKDAEYGDGGTDKLYWHLAINAVPKNA
jgi:hypothetical protein